MSSFCDDVFEPAPQDTLRAADGSTMLTKSLYYRLTTNTKFVAATALGRFRATLMLVPA